MQKRYTYSPLSLQQQHATKLCKASISLRPRPRTQAHKRRAEENPTWFDSRPLQLSRCSRRHTSEETTAKRLALSVGAEPKKRAAYFHHIQAVHKYARACFSARLTSENELDGSLARASRTEGYKGVVPCARYPTRRFSERTQACIRFRSASTYCTRSGKDIKDRQMICRFI